MIKLTNPKPEKVCNVINKDLKINIRITYFVTYL
jgi:hypothetical protein